MFSQIQLTAPTGFCLPCPTTPPMILDVLRPTTLAATANNYNPAGLEWAGAMELSASVPVSITGLAAQVDGFVINITNLGANAITLEHADAGSAAANRFYLPGGVDVVLAQYDAIALRYSTTAFGWVSNSLP